LYVEKADGQVRRSVRELPRNSFPSGAISVQVAYSSLNYKDALAATGHPGVAKIFPLVPGIDAVGTVTASSCRQLAPGDQVILGHIRFGTEAWGGYAQLANVPADWAVPLPANLKPYDAMALGTAGFTAAQCVLALLAHGADPGRGEIVVSGATGGVGIIAVMLLAKLGFAVVASTGKPDRADWLRMLGAARVIDRESLIDTTNRPLLSGQWQGAVDTVGGATLGTILRSTRVDGCVTACGLVGGSDLPVTVYPFILRGVILHGIDSGNSTVERRIEIWSQLAGAWKIEDLAKISQTVTLDELSGKIDAILAGKIVGRTVVDLETRQT
jgi:putative YhdH/YhfP family quinone oxidoreductase